MMAYYPSATSVEDAQAITVVEGSEQIGIDIRLPERSPYSIAGRVFGPENQPGLYARIRIERRDELGYVETEFDVTTYGGIDGSWRIPGVPAGDYVVSVFGPIKEEPQRKLCDAGGCTQTSQHSRRRGRRRRARHQTRVGRDGFRKNDPGRETIQRFGRILPPTSLGRWRRF